MNRIVKIHVNDIAVNQKEMSEMVNNACRRRTPMKVAGLCQVKDQLVVSLEETNKPSNLKYIFSPFPSENEEELITEIDSRYHAGFSTIGDFYIANKKWGLFAYAGHEAKSKRKKSDKGRSDRSI